MKCESAKDWVRIRLFEKRFSLFNIITCLILFLFLLSKTLQAWFFTSWYASFPRVSFSNSATAVPQPGKKKEEGLNNTEHTGKAQKVSFNLT